MCVRRGATPTSQKGISEPPSQQYAQPAVLGALFTVRRSGRLKRRSDRPERRPGDQNVVLVDQTIVLVEETIGRS